MQAGGSSEPFLRHTSKSGLRFGQANAQAISTADTITQTVINIR